MTIEIPLTLTLSRQGREDKKRRLPRPDKSGLVMTKGKELAMTREFPTPIKNTGKTRYNS
jgi:hypothetical protein